jgi:nucleotide-binding universal stress UspA family protein
MAEKHIPLPQFRTILFAANLSERSQDAFRVACALASEEASRLIVLYVVEGVSVVEQAVGFGEPGILITSYRDTTAHQSAILDRLRELYVPSSRIDVEYLTREGEASEEILRVAEELRCDLIVTGTHGWTGLDRALFGSVAESVLRHAHCPVVTVRTPHVGSAVGATANVTSVVN